MGKFISKNRFETNVQSNSLTDTGNIPQVIEFFTNDGDLTSLGSWVFVTSPGSGKNNIYSIVLIS